MEKSKLLQYVGRMEQLASIRRYVFEDGKGRGMRAMEVANSSGFDFTVYPDRGLDIGPARWNGRPLTWMTRNGPVNPAFYDASGCEWLRTWAGGLLTTCGWNNVGGPGDTATGPEGLHGRADHTPAEEVNARSWWDGADYRMEITGRIVHSRVFGEHLVTTRTIATRYGHPGLEVTDRTENCGSASLPFMQLYHMNFGFPLISESARLMAADHPIVAKDRAAESGLREWNTMPSPTAGFAEQVMYHDLPAAADGFAAIRITNPDFFQGGQSLALSFRKAELPYLIQWRQAGVGDYVMGLEPANCQPIGQQAFAETGKLRMIEPGETVETQIRVAVTR